MAGKKRRAGGKASVAASNRKGAPTEDRSIHLDNDGCLAVIISRLLEIASSPSRSAEVLQAFCDQKCLVETNQTTSPSLATSPNVGTSSTSPTSSSRSKKPSIPSLPHLDCYWIILGTNIMNRLLVLKDSQKKKIDRIGRLFMCLGALSDAIATILLHDKAKLEKASQSLSTAGSSRSILCRAILSTTISSLNVVQNYDPNDHNHCRVDAEEQRHSPVDASVETLYRMVFLKTSEHIESRKRNSAEKERAVAKENELVTMNESWPIQELKQECAQVEDALGTSIKQEKTCVEHLLESLQGMEEGSIDACIDPPPAKRTRRGAMKPSPGRSSPRQPPGDEGSRMAQIVSSFEKLLNANDFGLRIDGRVTLKRWSSIAVVWSQNGNGQAELLLAIHKLSTNEVSADSMSPSHKSSLMYRLMVIATEVGSQCGARPTSSTMDQYIKSISSSNGNSSSYGKRGKNVHRSDIRDISTLIIYDFLMNHRKCLEEVARFESLSDVVDDYEGKKVFLAPKIKEAITNLCNGASTTMINSTVEEQNHSTRIMLTIAAGHVLGLVADPLLPLDCNLASFALGHISQCFQKIKLPPSERESKVQNFTSKEMSDVTSTIELQESFIKQHSLLQPIHKPSVTFCKSSSQKCTYAGVLPEDDPLAANNADHQQLGCILLRALHGCGDKKKSPFCRLLVFLIEVLHRVYDTRNSTSISSNVTREINEERAARKRKSLNHGKASRHKGSRRRKMDKGKLDVEHEEEQWHKITSLRAAVAVEALSCLTECFSRSMQKDSTFIPIIQNCITLSDFKSIIALGKMLDHLIVDTQFEAQRMEGSQHKDSTTNKGTTLPRCRPIEYAVSSHEKNLWEAHMSMAQALGQGQTLLGNNLKMDLCVWGGTKRFDVYEAIASTLRNCHGQEVSSLPCIPSASHAFLASNLLSSSSRDLIDAERSLVGAYIFSITGVLRSLQKQDREIRDYAISQVPLSYNDARTVMLTARPLALEEKQSFLCTLVQATYDLFQTMKDDDSVKLKVLQNEMGVSFLARVLVLISSWSGLISDKNLDKALQTAMASFSPPFPIVLKDSKWRSNDTSFLSLFDNRQPPSLTYSVTERKSTVLSDVEVEKIRNIFYVAFTMGFESAAFDHGYMIFAAWNGLARLPQKSLGGLETTPCLQDSEEVFAQTILQMREDLVVVGAINASDETVPMSQTRLKGRLKRMMMQAKDTIERLLGAYIPDDDEIRHETPPAALALLAALPSYMSAILSCFTKPGNNFLYEQIQISRDTNRRQRGYSSESEPLSEFDSENEDDDGRYKSREVASKRLKECCEALGGAPIHPDWLDTTCSLPDGFSNSDLAEVAEIAIVSLSRLAVLSLRQDDKYIAHAISGLFRGDSAQDLRVQLCLSLLQWIQKDTLPDLSVSHAVKEDVAMFAQFPIEVLDQLLDVSVSKDILHAREWWCPLLGRRHPGLLIDGNHSTGRWNVTHAELRAQGEWELLLSEAFTLVCIGDKKERAGSDHPDKLESSDILAAQLWRQVWKTAINHMVPAAALLRSGIMGNRCAHPFSSRQHKWSPQSGFPLPFLETFSQKANASHSLSATTNEALSLVARVGVERGHSVSPVCQAIATHLLFDMSSYAVLQNFCFIANAFKTLWQIIEFMDAAPKTITDKESNTNIEPTARLVELLLSVIEKNGKMQPEEGCQKVTGATDMYTQLHNYLFVSGANAIDTIADRSIDAAYIVNESKNPIYSDQRSENDPLLTDDREITSTNILVRLLCDESLHASSHARGLCVLLLSRMGSLQARVRSTSLPNNGEFSALPAYVKAFDGIEKKHLAAIVEKDLSGMNANFPIEFGQELADLLSLLLTNRPQSLFKNSKIIMESLMVSLDALKRISFQSQVHLISVSVTYGACFGKLVEIGSLLVQGITNQASEVSSSGNVALLSCFLGALAHLHLESGQCDRKLMCLVTNPEAMELDTPICPTNNKFNLPQACTFVQKSGFHGQHWYSCHTCELINDRGCCSLCALVCHKGHDVSYSRFSSFFCDCGAEGNPAPTHRVQCKCLSPLPANEVKKLEKDELVQVNKPKKESIFDKSCFLGKMTFAEISWTYFREDALQSLSKLRNAAMHFLWMECLFREIQHNFHLWKETNGIQLDQSLGEEMNALHAIQRTPLDILMKRLQLRQSKDLSLESLDKQLLVPVYCASGFEAKFSTDSATNTIGMARLSRSEISRNILAADSRGRAVLVESTTLTFFIPLPTNARHIRQLHDQSLTRRAMTILGTATLKFNVVGLQFSVNERLLVVWGASQASVLVINSSFSGINETKTTNLSFDLDGEDHILKCAWIPGSQFNIAVCSSRFLRLYDIREVETNEVSSSRIEKRASPMIGCNLGFEASIRDISIVPQRHAQQRRGFLTETVRRGNAKKLLKLYLLLENGRLHSLDITTVNGIIQSSDSDFHRKECVAIPTHLKRFFTSLTTDARSDDSKSLGEGSNIMFLKQSRVLLYQCKSNSVLALVLGQKGEVVGGFELLPPLIPSDVLGEAASISGPFTHWTELGVVYRDTGAFFRLACVGRSTSLNQQQLLCIEFNELHVKLKDLPFSLDSLSSVERCSFEGLAAFSFPIVNSSPDGTSNQVAERVFLLVMNSNGKAVCLGDNVIDMVSIASEKDGDGDSVQPIMLASLPLENSGTQTFPLTIFERLVNVTESEDLIVLGDDMGVTVGDLKERILSKDNGVNWICPHEGCCIAFSLKSRDRQDGASSLALSAIRILLGSSTDPRPHRLIVQGRELEVTPGGKRWYNVVLTDEEVALGIRTGCISVCIFPSQDPGNLPVVESIEVYGTEFSSVVIPRSYFARSVDRTARSLPPPKTLQPKNFVMALEHALHATVSLSKVMGTNSVNSFLSVDVKGEFWNIVEQSVAFAKMNFFRSLKELASYVEQDESEMKKRLDESVLQGIGLGLNNVSSLIKIRSERRIEGESYLEWRSIYDIVREYMETAIEIAKKRPISFLQSFGKGVAASVSDIVIQGRRHFNYFDELISICVELLLTEMALTLLSDDSPTLSTLKNFFESPNDEVVEQCCDAICSFFKEHRLGALKSGNPDMFQQLEAARLVAYQCDACSMCPMKNLRYTLEEEGIDLCHECYIIGSRCAKRSSNPTKEVKINGSTVGNDRALTCEDFKRLKPVPIERLEIASTSVPVHTDSIRGQHNQEISAKTETCDKEDLKTARETSLEGLESFLGRIFYLFLDRVSFAMNVSSDPNPLFGLLLELIRQTKVSLYQAERAQKFVTTVTNEILKLLDGNATKLLQSRDFTQKLGTAVMALRSLANASSEEDEALDLVPKQVHSQVCRVHGIAAVRRRCAHGPNKDRRFYVCGMEKDLRCDFFAWADSCDDRGCDGRVKAPLKNCGECPESQFTAVVRNAFLDSSSLSGLLHVKLCRLFEDEFLSRESALTFDIRAATLPRKKARERNSLNSFRRTMQTVKVEYDEGVFCSKEKLQGSAAPSANGEEGGISFGETTAQIDSKSDERSVLFETVLDLVTQVADHKTAGIARWFSLLCDLVISPDTLPHVKRISTKALQNLCHGDDTLYRSLCDCHSFQFYLKRIYVLSAGNVASAVVIKEKAHKCGETWNIDAVCLSKCNAAALIGTEMLVSEDAVPELNRKNIGKAFDELWAIARNRGNNWRQFCGLPSFPQSLDSLAIHQRSNQVKALRLIDFALCKEHQDVGNLKLGNLTFADERVSIQCQANPEQILVSSDRTIEWADVVAISLSLVRDGKSGDLRRAASSVIAKVYQEFSLEDRWSVFRNLFPCIMNAGGLGKAAVDYLKLLQALSMSLIPREDLGLFGDIVINAFRQQLGAISINQCNGDWIAIEPLPGSSSPKRRNIDLSRCSFCCNENLNVLRGSCTRSLTRKVRSQHGRIAAAGGNSVVGFSSFVETSSKRKWHREQVSPFVRQRLEMETISSEFSLFFKLKHRIAISDLHMTISDPRGRYAKIVHIYFSPRPIAELSDLKGEQYISKWQKCATLKLSQGLTRISTSFPFPVVAANLKVEFAEFHERPGEGRKGADGTMIVLCPRCTSPVTNSHGVCGRCGDAVFQCRKCRHINYDRLDGFFCAECGYCPMGSFSFDVTAGVASNAVAITNDYDCKRTEKMLGEAVTIEEDLREALREKIQLMRSSQADTISSKDTIFDIEMDRAFMGLPPTLVDDSKKCTAAALLERFDTPGTVVKAVASFDGQQTAGRPGAERSERTRSLLNLARQIRNSSSSSSDRRSVSRGINLDNLEEILESGNVFETPAATEQPSTTGTSNPKNDDRKGRNKRSELETCQKLFLLAREAENEGTALRRRLDAWAALNSGSVALTTFQTNEKRFDFPGFSPSHCSSCAVALGCTLLELWDCLLKLGPDQINLEDAILDTLLGEGVVGSQQDLLEATKRAVVSMATTSKIGAELVLKRLRQRLATSHDRFCADILGKILQEKDLSKAEEFTNLAMEILSTHSLES
ncbi:GRF zinc finger domain containing protein [Nitzschia inconspicua]|uniref:GRF zinc finger domain containing protein n=1 Tax=Nitzschia inconspicua TaxID=303405 RepID=A0A9K3Q1W4_9STRA|nr:GRF zinc finger domain containing protein [Nitzschia inconspicua]